MKRKGCSGCAWVCLILFVALFIAPSTFKLVKEKWKIHQLLVHAKSIRIEHYRSPIDTRKFDGKEEIIAAKDLAHEDFSRVAAAFPPSIDFGIPGNELMCIFNPHHRIIITDAAGNVTTIKVCFECDHVEIKHEAEKEGDYFGTPFVWAWTLRRFFAEEGMPNSPQLYRPDWETEKTNGVPTGNEVPTSAPQ